MLLFLVNIKIKFENALKQNTIIILNTENLIIDNEKYNIKDILQIDFGGFIVLFANISNENRGNSKIELWIYPLDIRILYIKYPIIEYKYEMVKTHEF